MVPKGTLPFASEPLPHLLAVRAVILENFSGIMKLIGGRDEAYVGTGLFQVLNVVFLALAPRWLRIAVAIRTALDYMGHTIAKAKAHFLKHGLAAAILDNVMQQGGNSEVFITPSFKNQGADTYQVSDIRYAGLFTGLCTVL